MNQPNAEKMISRLNRVEIDDGWFEVLELPDDIFAIMEPGHIQEVCSFLIIGAEKAIFFDTGMGIGDISSVVKQLTDLEIIVVNSHTHFDHIGDNWRFDAIFVYADEYAVDVLNTGFSHWDVRYDADAELFSKGFPSGFDLDTYHIKPVDAGKIHLLHDGDIINLGNRQVKVLHTPGHSQDGIMLFDRENKALFTGDTYCEWLFAFLGDELPRYGRSNLQDYEQTMKAIAKLVPDLDTIYPSHGKPIADPRVLVEVAKALEMVNDGEVEYTYEVLYGADRRVYEFDGFTIWI